MSSPRSYLAPGSAAIAAAARALSRVLDPGMTAEAALDSAGPSAADRPAARAILTGTLRLFPRLAVAVDALLRSPGRTPQPWLRALLACALHQIEHSRAHPASAVNIAVDACRALGERRAAGLVNAVLRRYLREREDWQRRFAEDPLAASAHPAWLRDAIVRAWPDAAGEVLQAGNEAPPMVLRADLSRTTREVAMAALQAEGVAGAPGWTPTAIVIDEPRNVDHLPGFAAGAVSVQDTGAQLAAVLLDAQPGERVLDACAAPGGKTGHLLERTPGLDLTALDSDASRLERVKRNLERLGREAALVHADLRDPDAWWDGRPFDRVLLDAPCSGTGVIRRHPDIKLLRRASDIDGFAQLQAQLLRAAVAVLRPGGRLLYSTCSVLPQENAAVVKALLADDPRLEVEPPADGLQASLPPLAQVYALGGGAGVQILPVPVARGPGSVTDGFHYVCLRLRDE